MKALPPHKPTLIEQISPYVSKELRAWINLRQLIEAEMRKKSQMKLKPNK